MNQMRPQTAKIIVHSEGLGIPNMEMVRKRASEIATINGRDTYTEEDWRIAKIELHGTQHDDGALSEETGCGQLVSERDMIATNTGHHTQTMRMEDDGNIAEDLFLEGMDEAEHERMLAARAQSDADLDEDGAD